MEPNTYSARRRTSLRRLLDGLDGHWPAELAAVDARGAAGADLGAQAPSTAGRLRNRLHLSHDTASGWVRTAQALTDGAVSRAHGAVVAAGTHDPRPHRDRRGAGAGGDGSAAGPTPAAPGH